MGEYLKKYQILYINGVKYIVENMVEFKEDTWVWQEYEVIAEGTTVRKWLCVEQIENNQIECFLYQHYSGSANINGMEFFVGAKRFSLFERGTATVSNYFGNADVDMYERCSYTDYISEDENTIISIENWSDEGEVTIGNYIDNSQINITNELDQERLTKEKKGKKIGVLFMLLMFGFLLLSAFLPLVSGLFVNKSIEKYLDEQTTKYSYVTSITNNTNNKKAKVYESAFLSIDSTVKDIIDGVPEGITETIDTDTTTEDDGIGLQTKNEYAYIYEEDGNIYIQVSSKQYVNNSGTTYHSHRHRHYYNSYSSNQTSTTYSNYAYSARQNSINSRKSSGGGTSSGK